MGFTSLAPLRLVWALLVDASEGGVDRERVDGVRDVVVHLDAVMAQHPDVDTEELRRARALVPGLLLVLDGLLGADPGVAWTRYRSLRLLAGAGLLEIGD